MIMAHWWKCLLTWQSCLRRYDKTEPRTFLNTPTAGKPLLLTEHYHCTLYYWHWHCHYYSSLSLSWCGDGAEWSIGARNARARTHFTLPDPRVSCLTSTTTSQRRTTAPQPFFKSNGRHPALAAASARAYPTSNTSFLNAVEDNAGVSLHTRSTITNASVHTYESNS